jgi:hypothetical protein
MRGTVAVFGRETNAALCAHDRATLDLPEAGETVRELEVSREAASDLHRHCDDRAPTDESALVSNHEINGYGRLGGCRASTYDQAGHREDRGN